MGRKKQWFAISEEAFFAQTKTNEDGCMIWQGQVASNGYPVSYRETGGEERLAQRQAWKFANGPIPKGMAIVWKCGNRLCINPEHLEMGKSRGGGRKPKEKTEKIEVREREIFTETVREEAPVASVATVPARVRGKTDRPKAVGILNGTGGMAIGFERAGFEVLGSLEADSDYGKSYRLNRPDQFSVESIDMWEKIFPGITDDVILATGHPPCQGVSGMNAQAGGDNAKNKMLPLAAQTGIDLGASYIILENIPRMLSLGREYVDQVREIAKRHGYVFEAHKHFVGDFGVSQKRRRVMFVLSKRSEHFHFPAHPNLDFPTVRDVISDLERVPVTHTPHEPVTYVGEADTEHQDRLRNEEGYTWNHYDDPLPERYAHVPVGKRWDHMPREVMSEKERRKVEENDGWYNAAELVRVDPDNIGRTVTGARNKMHYSQCRRLTVREIARLMGFPDEWRFARELNWQQVAAGVCPPVAEWYGRVLMAQLAGTPLLTEGALF